MQIISFILVITTAIAVSSLPSNINDPRVAGKLKLYREAIRKTLTTENNDSIGTLDETVLPQYHVANNKSYEISHINAHLAHQLYQGDIALTPEQLDDMLEDHLRRSKRQALRTPTKSLWNKTGIPYKLDLTLTDAGLNAVEEAIRFWETHTCLKFVEDPSQSPHLNFFKGAGCYSFVGKLENYSSQDISVGNGCDIMGTVTHEIAHSLGFMHTQSRYDRNRYVKILTENIMDGHVDQFDRSPESENENFGLPYDYGSVMHYSDVSFAKNVSKPVIKSLQSSLYQHTMGNRIQPSFIDIQMMNDLYNCNESCKGIPEPQCINGGFQNPASCSDCVCPFGFAGQTCSERAAASNGSLSCGATIKASDTWTPLSAVVGDNEKRAKEEYVVCTWFFEADVNYHIEIEIQSVGPTCSSGCFYNGVEFKMADFELTGYRLCCSKDAKHMPRLTSESNKAIIIAYASYYKEYFNIQYRQVL